MTYKSFKAGLVAGIGATLLPQTGIAQSTPKGTPNVLFLIVDDWGVVDLSYAGSKFYETPNVDALSQKATFFDNGYVAYPRSVPSRYSLMTGRHCARPQKTDGKELDDRKVDKNSYCIAEPFKAAGYETFFMGKWHLATDDCMPQDKGFDINIGGGHAGATTSYFAPFNVAKNGRQDGKEKPIEGMDDTKENEYLTDYMSRKMVSYLEQKREKPFFAVCSFYAVHTPLQSKEEITARFEKKRKQLGLNDNSYIKEEAGESKVQQNNPVYAGMIYSVDEAIGNIVDALKRTKQYDNTIIVLIGDNGGLSSRGNSREVATSNLPYKAGKGHLYEGGVRVPFFILMPGQKKGVRSETPASGLDIFPTLVDLCHLKTAPKTEFDGVSLRPVLEGKRNELNNRPLFWHKIDQRPTSTGDYISSAVRKGDYKLIDFYKQGRVELYNLKSDPSEQKNIAQSEPKKVEELMKELNGWRKDVKANMVGKTANKEKKKEK